MIIKEGQLSVRQKSAHIIMCWLLETTHGMEWLLESGCPARDCISQTALQLGDHVTEFWPAECEQNRQAQLPGPAHKTLPCSAPPFFFSFQWIECQSWKPYVGESRASKAWVPEL